MTFNQFLSNGRKKFALGVKMEKLPQQVLQTRGLCAEQIPFTAFFRPIMKKHYLLNLDSAILYK